MIFKSKKLKRTIVAGSIMTAMVAGGLTGAFGLYSSPTILSPPALATTANPSGHVCGSSILDSPFTYTGSTGSYTSGTAGLPTFGSTGTNFPNATAGVVVGPGSTNLSSYQSANTVYYFKPGTYNVTGSAVPGSYVAYVGGFSGGIFATWDGGRSQQHAIDGGSGADVTLEYLIVQNFMPNSGDAVIADGNQAQANWVVQYDTMQDNGNVPESNDGAALMMSTGDVYQYNCLTNNGEYAINAAMAGGANYGAFASPAVNYNEISWDGISYYPNDNGCGCSGGIKFWQSYNAHFVGNYVHNNYLVGVWFDTNNTGALIQKNFFLDNRDNAIIYEISYNADIDSNIFIGNGFGNQGAAVGISGSGGNTGQTGSNYLGNFYVTNNTLVNNWSGIVVEQNADRFCSQASGQPFNAGGDSNCTLQPNFWVQTYPSATSTLTGGLSGGNLPLSSTSGWSYPGWVQDNGTLGPTFYYYTGISGNNLTGVSLVNGASTPASGDAVSQQTGCRAAIGLPLTLTIPSSSITYAQACEWTSSNITVSGNLISFNPTTVQNMTAQPCNATSTACGLNGQWVYFGTGFAGQTISSSQTAYNVNTCTAGSPCTLSVTATNNLYQSVGWLGVQTSTGYAIMSFSGISGDTIEDVVLVTGYGGVSSGTVVPGGSTGIAGENCQIGGAPSFSCGSNSSNTKGYDIQNGTTWSNNSYYGAQSFAAFPYSQVEGTTTTWTTWSGTPAGTCTYAGGSCSGPYGQDSGSSFANSGGPYWNQPVTHPAGVG